jgi:hypothetical protein
MSQVPIINPLRTTLDKFGVPIAGTSSGLGILMPKLKHRFRVIVYNFGDNTGLINVTRQVVTAGRPSINYNETPLHSYNNIVYIAQKPEWSTIEVVVRDDITNLVTSSISSQVQKQMNHYSQSAASAASNYKFQMELQILDGTMNGFNTLESWYLEGCYLTSVAYGDTDYSSSDPVTITMTIRYDNATQGNEASTGTINSLSSIAAAAASAISTGVTA